METRDLQLTAEDADLLGHMLRFVFKNHPSPNIKEAAADFLNRLENLKTQA